MQFLRAPQTKLSLFYAILSKMFGKLQQIALILKMCSKIVSWNTVQQTAINCAANSNEQIKYLKVDCTETQKKQSLIVVNKRKNILTTDYQSQNWKKTKSVHFQPGLTTKVKFLTVFRFSHKNDAMYHKYKIQDTESQNFPIGIEGASIYIL